MTASAQHAARRKDARGLLDTFVSFLDWFDESLDVIGADHHAAMKALSAAVSRTHGKLVETPPYCKIKHMRQ
jgi:hypothetical protein